MRASRCAGGGRSNACLRGQCTKRSCNLTPVEIPQRLERRHLPRADLRNDKVAQADVEGEEGDKVGDEREAKGEAEEAGEEDGGGRRLLRPDEDGCDVVCGLVEHGVC